MALDKKERFLQSCAHMKKTTFPLNNSMNHCHCPLALLLIPFALACFALSPQSRATCQQGCLANGNTVLGDGALVSNAAGMQNTAIGESALAANTSGNFNTACGRAALSKNTTGIENAAIGNDALFYNTTGNSNTAIGHFALLNNITGNRNLADGIGALVNNTGSDNVALGNQAGGNLTTGDHNIDIGNRGIVAEANTIRIGDPAVQTATFIAGINGAMVTGSRVVVNSSGQVGVAPSSQRFKEAIKPMEKASEAILALKPVTFRYKHDLDPNCVPQFGLVAEQVEKVNPDLVARDEQGKPYTVRYEAVNAMLLNEFLKEHRRVQDLEANAVRQQKQIEALTAGLQKVNAQLELSTTAPQTVSR